VADIGIFERPGGAAAHVTLAHSDHETDYDGSFNQPLAVLRRGCKMLVDMHRVLVHAQQAEERVVELGDGAAGPVPKALARF